MRSFRFGSIKQAYRKYYFKEFYITGKVPIKDTELGMWGTSSAEDVFRIFNRLAISGKFADLGSGDGKVVLIASLFCDSVAGIECDKELVSVSRRFSSNLGIKADFSLGDYMDADLSSYEWLFLSPDHPITALEDKLIKELKGRIIVYSNLYFFTRLNKVQEFESGSVKVIVYSNRPQRL